MNSCKLRLPTIQRGEMSLFWGRTVEFGIFSPLRVFQKFWQTILHDRWTLSWPILRVRLCTGDQPASVRSQWFMMVESYSYRRRYGVLQWSVHGLGLVEIHMRSGVFVTFHFHLTERGLFDSVADPLSIHPPSDEYSSPKFGDHVRGNRVTRNECFVCSFLF